MKPSYWLTTNQGVPVSDNQNSKTAGQQGPTLLEDYHLIEKLAHFDRERIPDTESLLGFHVPYTGINSYDHLVVFGFGNSAELPYDGGVRSPCIQVGK